MGKTQLRLIELRGYKSIPYDSPLKIFFGDVTILLGANGSGKSNILNFFRMLQQMMRGNLQRYIAEAGSNQKFLYYGPKKTPSLSASLRFEDESNSDVYEFNLARAVPDRLIITGETVEFKKAGEDGGVLTELPMNYNESALVDTSDEQLMRLRNLLSSCKVFQFSDSSVLSPMRQTGPVDTANYLQSDGGNLAAFLYFLKNNYGESYRRIRDYVREVVPQFHDFYLAPTNGYISLKWIDKSPNDYVMSADQLSDGSMRFIALATLLLEPEETMPSLIIIDEPELGLHPYAVDQLNEMINDASNHSQIVVATQSPALIDGFPIESIRVIERNDDSAGTIVRELKDEEFKDWLEEYTVSELWNKNLIGGRPL